MESLGLLHLYYGDGKGKTTAAMGLALRALGSGKRVVIVQFLKGVLEEKSLEILERMDLEMKVFRFERSRCYFEDLPEDQKKEETMNLRNGFNFAKKVMATGECDLLILDEVLGLVEQEVISREEFIRFLQSADDETDLIMTGRVCPDEIRQYADQISYVENL